MSYIKIKHYSDAEPFELIELPQDTSAWLRAVYSHLECDTIDVANTIIPGLILIIDDNGKMNDGWHSKINQYASALYPSAWDPIVGNVILARRDDPEIVPLTPEDIERVFRYFSI